MTTERDTIGNLLDSNSKWVEDLKRYAFRNSSSLSGPDPLPEIRSALFMIVSCLDEQHQLLVLLDAELGKLKHDTA